MSTPHARNIVRRLLAGNKSMRVQELYKQGLSDFPATPFPAPPPPRQFPGKKGVLKPAPPQPPHPSHPFRSHAYFKSVVLPELVDAGEVEKFHTVTEVTGTPTKKRITKSKNAIASGGQDVWLWRLKGPQAEAPEPRLEEEPAVNEVGWYQPNQLFPTGQITEEVKKKNRDSYGAGRFDHLNVRRRNARPDKIRLEREWGSFIAAARAEGGQSASGTNETSN